jgi:coenzyme F420-reducing hydrogenase delta subunit
VYGIRGYGYVGVFIEGVIMTNDRTDYGNLKRLVNRSDMENLGMLDDRFIVEALQSSADTDLTAGVVLGHECSLG